MRFSPNAHPKNPVDSDCLTRVAERHIIPGYPRTDETRECRENVSSSYNLPARYLPVFRLKARWSFNHLR